MPRMNRYPNAIISSLLLASGAYMACHAQPAPHNAGGSGDAPNWSSAPFRAASGVAGAGDVAKMRMTATASGIMSAAGDDAINRGAAADCVRLVKLCRRFDQTRLDVVAARSLLPSSPNMSPAGIRISRRQITVHYTFR